MVTELRREPHFTPTNRKGTSALVARDLYLPGVQGPFPLVIYVDGGAFKFGDKGDNEATGAFLLAAGYTLASINYRLSGEARLPAQIRDVKSAVRWLSANAVSC
jgi:acetyl esterase/lipase